MVLRWLCTYLCSLHMWLRSAAGQSPDVGSLVQHSLAVPADLHTQVVSSFLHQLMANKSLTESRMKAKQSLEGPNTIGRAVLGELVDKARSTIKTQEDMLNTGWKAFAHRAASGGSSKPHDLLKHAKAALLETGALVEMRQAARASAAMLQGTKGLVPLDSMMVGFRTSLATWNNVLKEFSLPLIKASFTLFANFFGPEGNAARLCLSAAVITDSTYGVHARWEFGGINIFAGPAKWDNVPGWNFGASGGIDDARYFDIADFGWKWTLAHEPETLCFFFDICVIDSEGLHHKATAALQTDAKVQSGREVPIHGSTWVEHVWCSPDWTNTPLMIEETGNAGAASRGMPATLYEVEKSKDKTLLKFETWDPETEPV
mmetsp:Transcript_17897/g.42085  ORF Transcript_17897/g.42085 Transcript_17897/m.42085 type:complete len:374 (-) Transcript_17897:62-1183(-)